MDWPLHGSWRFLNVATMLQLHYQGLLTLQSCFTCTVDCQTEEKQSSYITEVEIWRRSKGWHDIDSSARLLQQAITGRRYCPHVSWRCSKQRRKYLLLITAPLFNSTVSFWASALGFWLCNYQYRFVLLSALLTEVWAVHFWRLDFCTVQQTMSQDSQGMVVTIGDKKRWKLGSRRSLCNVMTRLIVPTRMVQQYWLPK